MLTLKLAVESMFETKLLALNAMLRTMIIPMFIMIGLGLLLTYNNTLTSQMPNMEFQMQSRDTLHFNKNVIKSQEM